MPVETGILLDGSFENGVSGTPLDSSLWTYTTVSTTNYLNEYRAAAPSAKIGSKYAWISAVADSAGDTQQLYTPTNVFNIGGTGAEIRFWLYIPTLINYKYLFGNYAVGGSVLPNVWARIDSTGTVAATTSLVSPPVGYTGGGYITIGAAAVSTGWTQFRITYDFAPVWATYKSYTLSVRTSLEASWTPLKSATANDYYIPMRGTAPGSSTGDIGFRASGSVGTHELGIDDVRYSASGITDLPASPIILRSQFNNNTMIGGV